MKMINDNIFKYILTEDSSSTVTFIPHVVNSLKGWGAGFVLALSRFNRIPESKYRQWGHLGYDPFAGNFELGNIQIVELLPTLYVVNMLAQDGYKSSNNPTPLNYVALASCMTKLRDKILEFPNACKCVIEAPKFGSDLAGGDWDVISGYISEIWEKNGIPVNIYYL